MMRKSRLAGLGAIALLLTGCAGRAPRPPLVEPGVDGARTVVARLAEYPCPDRLAGECEIRVLPTEGPAVRLYGSFRADWPERIRLQARLGPFLPVASIAVDEDSASVSLPRQKAYWSGPASRDSGPAGMAAGLLWLLCPSPLAASIQDPQLARSGKEWTVGGRGLIGGRTVTVALRLDGSQQEVREIVLLDSQGKLLVRALRDGKVRAGGGTLPRRVRFDFADPPGSYEVEIRSVRSDPEQAAGLFRIPRPSGAQRIGDADLFELFRGGASDR